MTDCSKSGVTAGPGGHDDLAAGGLFPRLGERLIAGGRGSILLSGLPVLATALFLLATVHHRDMRYVAEQWAPNRWKPAITTWIEDGYFKHGGMLYLPEVPHRHHPELRESPRFYRSLSGGFLQGVHLLQRFSYWISGRYSYRLTTLHNQAVIAATSALLGLLATRLARRLGAPVRHAILLGFGTGLVYQTFPTNLFVYWEVSPQAVLMLFVAVFLVIEESTFDGGSAKAGLRALTVFAMVYSDHIGAFFFLTGYALALATMRPDLLGRRRWTFCRDIPIPALLALGVYGLQLTWLHLRFPDVDRQGSGFLFRSGLDGSREWYDDHLALLFGRRLSYPYPKSGFVEGYGHWQWLFLAGVAGLLILAALNHRVRELRCPTFVLSVSLLQYVLYAFVFSQAVVIHSDLYDPLLFFPLAALVFSVLPSLAERGSGHTGLFVLAAVVASICYAMVQLRTYAAMIPLGPS